VRVSILAKKMGRIGVSFSARASNLIRMVTSHADRRYGPTLPLVERIEAEMI